jgi:hypothetical protein
MRPAYSFLFSLVAVLFLGIIGAHLLDISTFNGYAGGFFLFEAGYIAGSFGRK